MKTLGSLLYVVYLSIGIAAGNAYAQGTIIFNNLSNGDPSPVAKSGGLVFLSSGFGSNVTPLNQDVNFMLVGGPSFSDAQVLSTWLVSDGTAKAIVTGPGHFADPAGTVFAVPGVAAGGTAFLSVAGWVGNYSTFQQAQAAGAPFGEAFFQSSTGGGGAPPVSMVGMPALVISGVPEPSTFAIAAAGLLLVAIMRLESDRSFQRGTDIGPNKI
jgi:hypothetical protein